MVLCAILLGGNRSTRDKDKSYYRLPAVISHQGSKTCELSKRRRDEWLVRIRREDITSKQYPEILVCSDHFFGSPARLYDVDNPDWAPSLKLGYQSGHSSCQTMERNERIAARNSRKRPQVDDDVAIDGVSNEDTDKDDEIDAVDGDNDKDDEVEDAEGNAACVVGNEVVGDQEMRCNRTVQTDLTSTYIRELEETIYVSTSHQKQRRPMKKSTEKVRNRRIF